MSFLMTVLVSVFNLCLSFIFWISLHFTDILIEITSHQCHVDKPAFAPTFDPPAYSLTNAQSNSPSPLIRCTDSQAETKRQTDSLSLLSMNISWQMDKKLQGFRGKFFKCVQRSVVGLWTLNHKRPFIRPFCGRITGDLCYWHDNTLVLLE